MSQPTLLQKDQQASDRLVYRVLWIGLCGLIFPLLWHVASLVIFLYDEVLFDGGAPGLAAIQEPMAQTYWVNAWGITIACAVLVGWCCARLAGRWSWPVGASTGVVTAIAGQMLWAWQMPELLITAALPPGDFFYLPEFRGLFRFQNKLLALIYSGLLLGIAQEVALRMFGARPGPWAALTMLGVTFGGLLGIAMPLPEEGYQLVATLGCATVVTALMQASVLPTQGWKNRLRWLLALLKVALLMVIAELLVITLLAMMGSTNFVLAFLIILFFGLILGGSTFNTLLEIVERKPVDIDRLRAGFGRLLVAGLPCLLAAIPVSFFLLLWFISPFEFDLALQLTLMYGVLLAVNLAVAGLAAVRAAHAAL